MGDDAEAFGDVVQSLVARAIDDVGRGRAQAWRELSTMDDRALRSALQHRLRQIASAQDPLHDERRALAQHVRRALSESAIGDASLPSAITDDYGRFSYELVKTAVWAMASGTAPDRNARSVTNRLIKLYLPWRDHEEPLDEVPAEWGSDGPGTELRRQIDGPRMAQDLVTRLTPEGARVVSMLLGGSERFTDGSRRPSW